CRGPARLRGGGGGGGAAPSGGGPGGPSPGEGGSTAQKGAWGGGGGGGATEAQLREDLRRAVPLTQPSLRSGYPLPAAAGRHYASSTNERALELLFRQRHDARASVHRRVG